eukprot:56532-Hanusia_phi.AAC.1
MEEEELVVVDGKVKEEEFVRIDRQPSRAPVERHAVVRDSGLRVGARHEPGGRRETTGSAQKLLSVPSEESTAGGSAQAV